MSNPPKRKCRNNSWNVNYKESELQQVKKQFSLSSCRNLSQYIRDLSLQAPFDIYRNRSFDAFVEEMILLRKEMEDIGKKISLTTDNELRLLQIQEEIKININKLIDICMLK